MELFSRLTKCKITSFYTINNDINHTRYKSSLSNIIGLNTTVT